MQKLFATSTMLLFLLWTATSQAKGFVLQPGTSIDGRAKDETGLDVDLQLVLDEPMFLVDREKINAYNLMEKSLQICTSGLSACEAKQCNCSPTTCDPSLLDTVGWLGVTLGGALLFVVGVVVGARAVR